MAFIGLSIGMHRWTVTYIQVMNNSYLQTLHKLINCDFLTQCSHLQMSRQLNLNEINIISYWENQFTLWKFSLWTDLQECNMLVIWSLSSFVAEAYCIPIQAILYLQDIWQENSLLTQCQFCPSHMFTWFYSDSLLSLKSTWYL